MGKAVQFIKDWMLPIAIATGLTICLLLNTVPLLKPMEDGFTLFARNAQPLFIAIMLFLQFSKISPHDLRFHRWHIILLTIQAVLFIILSLVAAGMEPSEGRILVECATLCFICPAAAAAGVITYKLGGDLSSCVTYVILSNLLASILIPLMIPVIHPENGATFLAGFFSIIRRVFPLLVFPLLAAWAVRYTSRRLQAALEARIGWAFYVWGICLTLAIYLACDALLRSGISIRGVVLMAVVSLLCTLMQFMIGRRAGRRYGHMEAVTAGQALGQKNTGFLIWLAYSFMTPVTAVAGGLYSIFQNIFNSWELYEKRKGESF